LSTSSKRYCFQVSDPNAPYVKITLVWNDPAGSLISGLPLVNNLDLAVIDQLGNTRKTDTASGGFDSINNVEQILLKRPAVGYYAAHVNAFNVPQGPQNYALIISGALSPALCDLEFDPTNRTCPNGCNGRGTCGTADPNIGLCICSGGFTGLDCSAEPCPNNCHGNGYCDFASGTCVCGNNYAPPTCAALNPPTVAPQPPPPAIISVAGPGTGISAGIFGGVIVAVFIVACLLAGIAGLFGAVKYLEYKRDKAHKVQEDGEDEKL